MTNTTVEIGHWSNLDPITVTKLLLFGEITPPEDLNERIRATDSPGVTALVDMASYLADDAPGRYAYPARATGGHVGVMSRFGAKL